MSYKSHILRVKKAGFSFPKKNEVTQKVYNMFPYLILPTNSQETVDLYIADQADSGYPVKKDEETGLYLALLFSPVLPGSHGIVRTSKGKWIADMSNVRALDSINSQFSSLNLGKYLAEAILADNSLPANLEHMNPDEDPIENPEGENIDPFKD